MFEEEKKKRNYGTTFLLCFLCCVLAIDLLRFAKSYTKTTVEQHEIGALKAAVGEIPANTEVVPCDYPKLGKSSSTEKLSARVDTWRARPPSSYCVKIESFIKLADSLKDGMYESRPFTVGEYNWTLIMYPKGNTKDGGSGWVSLYVRIDNSTLITNPRDVYAELKFFVYNRNRDQYLTLHETEARRFQLFKPVWGIPTVHPYAAIINPGEGYIFDGDQFVVGVDVFVAPTFNKWEVSSFAGNFQEPKFTWALPHFSSRDQDFYVSSEFSTGGRKWRLKMYPDGDGLGWGSWLSLYVVIDNPNRYEKMYLRAKLRVLDQRSTKHVEKTVDNWVDTPNKGWGFQQFVPLGDLRDSSKGFIVDDKLVVEVEILEFSKTDAFQN